MRNYGVSITESRRNGGPPIPGSENLTGHNCRETHIIIVIIYA